VTVLGTPWTPAEDSTLHAVYARRGIYAACDALPARSRQAILRRARRLKIDRRRRWTKRDDARLSDLWHEGSSLRLMSRELGRTVRTIYWRAQKIGLVLGCPPGWEYLSEAARRTGFATQTMRLVLAFAGVPLRRAVTKGTGGQRPPHIVEPEAVDDAVAAWMDSEPLHAAARRLGLTDGALQWRLEALGIERPEGLGRAHWRVRSADVEEAARVTPLAGYARERRTA
jgi:hypothetical protein